MIGATLGEVLDVDVEANDTGWEAIYELEWRLI